MSWLSTMWDNNRNFLGNAAKNAAPLLGAFVPGVGMLGAGLIGAAGAGIQKGANLGSILSAGGTDAALSGGLSALKGAFVPSSGAPPVPVSPDAINAAGQSATNAANAAMNGGASAATSGMAGAAPQVAGAAARGAGLGSKILNFADKHPEALGGFFQGIAGMPEANARAKMAQAEADRIALENEMAQSRAKALAPIQQALMAQFQQRAQGYPIAANPYTVGR